MWPYQPRNAWGGFAYSNMPPRPYQEQIPYAAAPPLHDWTHAQRPNIVRPYYPIVQNQPPPPLPAHPPPPPPHTQPPPPLENLRSHNIPNNNPYYVVQTAPTIDTDLRYGHKPPPPPPPEPQIIRSALFPSAINSSEIPMHSNKFPIPNYPNQSAHNFTNAPTLPKKPLPAWLKAELERLDKSKKSDDNKTDSKNGDDVNPQNEKPEISGTKWINENSSSDVSDAEESENNFINEKPLIYSKQINSMSERKGSFPFCQANNDLMDFQIAWSRLAHKERQAESAKIFTTTLTSVMLEVTSEMTREVIKDLVETLHANKGGENQTKHETREEKSQNVTLVAPSLVAYDSEEESSDEPIQNNPLQELLQLDKEPIVEDENIPLPKNYEKTKAEEKERNRRNEKRRSRDRSKHRSKKRSSSPSDSDSSSSSKDSSSSSSSERSKSKKRPKSYSSSKSKKLTGSETLRRSKKRSSDKTSSSSSRHRDRHHKKRRK